MRLMALEQAGLAGASGRAGGLERGGGLAGRGGRRAGGGRGAAVQARAGRLHGARSIHVVLAVTAMLCLLGGDTSFMLCWLILLCYVSLGC